MAAYSERRDTGKIPVHGWSNGEPIVGGGAGTGLSAKCEEAGGIDLIVIYNSGRYRMAGRGSLAGLMPYGDANQIVVEMASEVLPVVKHTPVLAGVNATDPFRQMDVFLPELKRDRLFRGAELPDRRADRRHLPRQSGRNRHVLRIGSRHDRQGPCQFDMLTTPYVFNEDDAAAMAEAGADVIVCHFGLTTGGSIGAETALTLEDVPGPRRPLGGSGAEGQQ